MKASFEFDGDQLRLYIKVEDDCERSLAKVMAKYNCATVHLDYGEDRYYSAYRDQEPKGVVVYLKEPPKCYFNGQACEKRCDLTDGGTGCKLDKQPSQSEG